MNTIGACDYYHYYYLLPWLLNCGFCRSFLNGLRRVGTDCNTFNGGEQRWFVLAIYSWNIY